ncbi:hypothetical protein [Oceanospirillum sediminis]|uniref:Uncharacterized protein n=1 Tax=Oceanospirillum sediminis TaxID=2760088 RepID=A0A839IR00_9GAMM|nr:hypothetical protein [Oceanospirillum sediminis]MBB1487094.1 hypothetical protein [Oceanospirillum sediminis]
MSLTTISLTSNVITTIHTIPNLTAKLETHSAFTTKSITLDAGSINLSFEIKDMDEFKTFCSQHNIPISTSRLGPTAIHPGDNGGWIHPAIEANENEKNTIADLISHLTQGDFKAQKVYFKDTDHTPIMDEIVRRDLINWHPEYNARPTPDSFLVAQFIEFDHVDDDYAEPVAIFAVPADKKP